MQVHVHLQNQVQVQFKGKRSCVAAAIVSGGRPSCHAESAVWRCRAPFCPTALWRRRPWQRLTPRYSFSSSRTQDTRHRTQDTLLQHSTACLFLLPSTLWGLCQWKVSSACHVTITSHQSQITRHHSPVTSHQSPVTSHQSPVHKVSQHRVEESWLK